MARKRNVFTADFEEFHKALAQLSHYQSFVSWQLGQAKKGLQNSLDYVERRGLKNQYGTGTGMSLFNIFHTGKLNIRAPFGKHVTRGRDLLPMADEMERRFNSLFLVSVFEALESYLKKLYGKFLYQLRTETGRDRPGESYFLERNPKQRTHKGTPPYYDKLARSLCQHDPQSALGVFKKQLEWNRVVRPHPIGLDFFDIVHVLGFCRHSIVHSEGRVSAEQLGTLNSKERDFVNICLHASLHGKEKMILPPTKTMGPLFEAVASYGWGVYILLAYRWNMEDDSPFFRGDDLGVRKVEPKF